MTCKAYQVEDQMMCQCGLQWDVGDPYEPTCKVERLEQVKNHIQGIEMSGNPHGRNKSTYDSLQLERVELEGLLRE
jgi:hypothetical protein